MAHVDQQCHDDDQPQRRAAGDHADEQELGGAGVDQHRDQVSLPGAETGLDGDQAERDGDRSVSAQQRDGVANARQRKLLEKGKR